MLLWVSLPTWRRIPTGSARFGQLRSWKQTSVRTQARFVLDAGAIKDTYTLAYTWQDDTEVTWTLVEAQILTAMDGAYRLSPAAEGGTDVEYELTLDLKIPMIGLLRRKAEKVVIDTALKELKKRVES